MNNILENKERMMKTLLFSLVMIFSVVVSIRTIGAEENSMGENDKLSQRQQGIIPIAAFTANGDIDKLLPALNQGLDDGLSINEIKEVMVHLYAYTGFPHSLNALSAFMRVLDERK